MFTSKRLGSIYDITDIEFMSLSYYRWYLEEVIIQYDQLANILAKTNYLTKCEQCELRLPIKVVGVLKSPKFLEATFCSDQCAVMWQLARS